MFFLIQVSYLIIIIIIRPFQEKTNNLVEIVNELVLTILISLLLFYNKSSRWNTTIEDIFIYSIMSNSIVVSLIFMTSLIYSITYKCIKRSRAKTEVKRFVNNETGHTALKRRNDTSVVDFDHHRNNTSVLGASSKVAFKKSINH